MPKIEAGQTQKIGIEPAEKTSPVRVALKFTPGDSTRYKLIQETGRQASWAGLESRNPTGFKGGQSGNRIEMTFNQQIQSTNDKENAVAKITIEGLKYQTKVTDKIILDFDSSRQQDQNSTLNQLIGLSYIIEVSSSGKVVQVSNTDSIQAAFMADTAENKLALRLLSEDAITERHTIPALPAEGKQEFNVGDNWKTVKSISFDQMGIKSFGKTYTLQEIPETDNHRFAIVRMDAIPSIEQVKELFQTQVTPPFPFDSIDTYSGQMKLDLTEGKVEQCSEKLLSEWIIIDPAAKNNERPDSIKMSATQLYSIERMY